MPRVQGIADAYSVGGVLDSRRGQTESLMTKLVSDSEGRESLGTAE